VIADGARLPFDKNVGLVRAAVELANRFEASVEAELGHIERDEDHTTAGKLTEPSEAKRFIQETGAACLAIFDRRALPGNDDPRLDEAQLYLLRGRRPVGAARFENPGRHRSPSGG
jgi:fructose-bisphosphate aldolase, class II